MFDNGSDFKDSRIPSCGTGPIGRIRFVAAELRHFIRAARNNTRARRTTERRSR